MKQTVNGWLDNSIMLPVLEKIKNFLTRIRELKNICKKKCYLTIEAITFNEQHMTASEWCQRVLRMDSFPSLLGLSSSTPK